MTLKTGMEFILILQLWRNLFLIRKTLIFKSIIKLKAVIIP